MTTTMKTLISALDDVSERSNDIQLGENGHIEHSWTNTTRETEMITQFYFQLVRSKNSDTLIKKLHKMIIHFSQMDNEGKYIYQEYLTILYSLIAHTRDIVEGKGEYDLAFMQIFVWYQYFPSLAVKALESFVKLDDKEKHPYGSWKDIKHFCEYVKEQTNGTISKKALQEHPLIKTAIYILLSQIDEDIKNMKDNKTISLVAKWCPREKGKYNWLYNAIIKMTPFYSLYMETATTKQQQEMAIMKIKTKFRKMISSMNKYIDTVQIKMCNKSWRDIDFNKVSSKSMKIYKHSFLNKKRDDSVKYPCNEDRIMCASNFKTFVDNVTQNKDNTGKKETMKGQRLDVYELVKDAIETEHTADKTITDTINAQWETNRKNNVPNIGNIIPMADTSGSMTCDNSIPLYNSIGLSIRVSECTNDIFKNRIMTFSNTPEWVKLDDKMTFTEKVSKVGKCAWMMNTNFYSALKMILDTIKEHDISPDNVKDMVLAVFSDMQIDCAINYKNRDMNKMFEQITKMYSKAGLESKWETPYSPPHILFWNLRQTDGFPSMTNEKNVTMLSGYSSVLLNEFANKGMSILQDYTPYKMVQSLLKKERYQLLSNFITNELEFSVNS